MKMKLVYFGSGAFGVPTLSRLVREHDVAMVVTQPDRPAGRGGKLTATPVAQWCADHTPGVEIVRPEDVNSPDVVERIGAVRADAFVVIAFGQKLGRALLRDVFAINLHASLLPRWRGAAPINSAMLGMDEVTGNSVITLAERMDAGRVLGQTTRRIDYASTAGELHDLLAGDGPDLVIDVLTRHQSGGLQGAEQDPARVTKAGKLARSDAWVDFSASAEVCRARIHALTPWPSVHAVLSRGGDAPTAVEMKLLRVGLAPGRSESGKTLAPGEVDQVRGVVGCGNSTALTLLSVQPSGKTPMSWEQFARGLRGQGPLTLQSSPPPPSGGAAAPEARPC